MEGDRNKNLTRSDFAVENTGRFYNGDHKKFEIIGLASGGWSFEKLKKSLSLGDVVVVIPRYLDSGILSKDDFGNSYIGILILRRAFGIFELQIQMAFTQ